MTRLPKYVYGALAILILGLIFLFATINKNPLHMYLLPENFTGEVEVTFNEMNSPPLEKEKNTYIYRVPMSGKLKTSTDLKSGPVEVYYVDDKGRRNKVSHEQFHGVSTSGGGDDNMQRARFFIGSKEQYESYVKNR